MRNCIHSMLWFTHNRPISLALCGKKTYLKKKLFVFNGRKLEGNNRITVFFKLYFYSYFQEMFLQLCAGSFFFFVLTMHCLWPPCGTKGIIYVFLYKKTIMWDEVFFLSLMNHSHCVVEACYALTITELNETKSDVGLVL